MLRFASINIEGDTHRDSVVSFLKDFQPDVVCFQEIFQPSIAFFERALQMKCHFLPMTKTNCVPSNEKSPTAPFGVGIFSNLPISHVRKDYYYGGSGDLPTAEIGNDKTLWRGVIRAMIEKGGEHFSIATTHFSRTADGTASEKQRKDMKNLLSVLADSQELILCGDFNAPRGWEIFSMLTQKYKDNIPAHYKSSLDPKLHRAGDRLEFMVDGLFSTKEYQVSDVQLTAGVSDHLAVTGIITRRI